MERKLPEDAFQKFLDYRDAGSAPSGYPLSYVLCDEVSTEDWRPFIGLMVSDELREAINSQNEWWRYLMDWQVWLRVLEEFDGDNAWSLRMQFVEPVVFASMLQPSSTRDRFGTIATNALHQANLRVDSTYPDRLDQDDKPGSHLSRSLAEKQLKRIGQRWKGYTAFQQRLESMDSKAYRAITRNFRNLASHGIAPRFEVGETRFVVRSVGPRTETVKQPDGTFRIVEDPTRMAVSYGFGGTPPLSLHAMCEANDKEFQRARTTLRAYEDLLRELLAALKKMKP